MHSSCMYIKRHWRWLYALLLTLICFRECVYVMRARFCFFRSFFLSFFILVRTKKNIIFLYDRRMRMKEVEIGGSIECSCMFFYCTFWSYSYDDCAMNTHTHLSGHILSFDCYGCQRCWCCCGRCGGKYCGCRFLCISTPPDRCTYSC